MIQNFAVLKPAMLALIGFLALSHTSQRANAADRVQFESAYYQVGPLQLRLARERGEPIARVPADLINGYLTKPEGNGPFPAIVHLHGCSGLPKSVKTGATNGFWPEQLAAWGYVVLVVDSFTTRGISQACSGGTAPRIGDAYGAWAYLSGQSFVDSKRIAVMGFSQGGNTALSLVQQRDFELFEYEGDRQFKAAIAFYPNCGSDGIMTVATLILIGELDDWTPSLACKSMMVARSGAGSPVKLMVYPGAYHAFDIAALQPGREYFGHWTEYNRPAAEQAIEEVRRFLAQQLGR